MFKSNFLNFYLVQFSQSIRSILFFGKNYTETDGSDSGQQTSFYP